MIARNSSAALIVLLLAGCGGGGGEPAKTAATPAPAAPAPAPVPPPAQVPTVTPSPVTPPVSNTPTPVVAPPPAPAPGVPPAPEPPAPPPPPPAPAEGTYVTGKVLRQAFSEFGQAVDHFAYPTTKLSKDYPDSVFLGTYTDSRFFSHYSFPRVDTTYRVTNFLGAGLYWDVSFNTGYYTLSAAVRAYVEKQSKEVVLVRKDGGFSIKDDDKFILNTTFAEWRGYDDDKYFIQLQVQDFNGIGADRQLSTASFNLCFHQYLPGVRRLTCSIHAKEDGQYYGVRVLDDSQGLGPVEYLPKR